jgi:transposase
MDGKKETLICPKCGSTDLRWLLGGKLGDQYHCPKCGYQGIALKGSEKFARQLEKGTEWAFWKKRLELL